MTTRIVFNQPFGRTLIWANSNTTIVVAGNSTVSNIATTNEVVESADIMRVWWGSSASNTWTVSRGANVVLYLNPTSDVHADFQEKGCGFALDNTANVVCNVSDASAFILIELGKQSANSDGQY